MTDGKNIVDVMKYVVSLYEDVSQLLLAVDGGMTERGFVSVLRSSCYLQNSSQVSYPKWWAPRSLTRLYSKGPMGREQPIAFFNVNLIPGTVMEPVVVWGSLRRQEIGEFGQADQALWFKWMAGHDTPSFLTSPNVEPFRLLVGEGAEPAPAEASVSEALAISFRRFEYAAVPMLSLTDDNAVRRIVTEPLLRSLAGSPIPESNTAP